MIRATPTIYHVLPPQLARMSIPHVNPLGIHAFPLLLVHWLMDMLVGLALDLIRVAPTSTIHHVFPHKLARHPHLAHAILH